VRLVEADARKFLPALPDESVDLIVTDPPYRFERGRTYFRNWFTELEDSEWLAIFGELYRVLKEDTHCYVFSDRRTKPIFDVAARAAGFRLHHPLTWTSSGSAPGSSCWRPQYEWISFYEKGYRPGNSRNRSDVLRAQRVVRGYPTEKPVELFEQLIAQTSGPGELVLDPFCGSGNVGRAARRLARRALLCDVEANFAARRLRLAAVRLNVAEPLRTRPAAEPVPGASSASS
jgi:site-specific DNA-methyltransferase (adenine-specific)